MTATPVRRSKRVGAIAGWGLSVMMLGLSLAACGPLSVESAPVSAGTTAPATLLCPPVPSGWNLALNDPLQHANVSQWDDGPDASLPGSNRTFSAAGYHLTAPAHEGSINGLANDPADVFGDLLFQATMVIQSGTQNQAGGAGLVLRSDQSSDDYFYRFDVNGDWSLELFLNTGANAAPTTIASGTNGYFKQGYGQANLLSAEAVENMFTLCVNGQRVTSKTITNNTIKAGQIGFEVDGGATLGAEAVFSGAHVWVP